MLFTSNSKVPTREQRTAWLAVAVTTLVLLAALQLGASVGDLIGAALISYTVTVVAVASKVPLRPAKVLAATTRGSVIAIVLTVLVLIGIVRSFKGA
ncbi:hypothetical protein ACFYUJ_38890 [Streptomyces sp. NPDC004520]|uniref:hypothetical protein n=1 Tax=Streptomyces sp. NPDC004520 TaxID=3364702 RepID=UPI0036C08EA7